MSICFLVEALMNYELHPLISKIKDAAYYGRHNENPYTNTKYSHFQSGALEKYYGEYISGEIDFKIFLSFHNTKKGYVWCVYDRKGYYANNNEGTGAKISSSLWYIEKINGKWDIAEIYEKP